MAYGSVNVPGVSATIANNALEMASAALGTANSAQSALSAVQSTANTALEKANEALSTAKSAQGTANTAQSKATENAAAIEQIRQLANTANNTANKAAQDASAAKTAAENAASAAKNAADALTKIANTITLPTQSGSLTYTGSAQSPTWNGYDSSKMTISGTTSGTNAGTYTANVTPKSGFAWPDGSTAAKSVSWTIRKASVAVPTLGSALVYTGSAQTPTWNGYNNSRMTISGNTSGTNAGTYTATFTLVSSSNFQWADGSTAAKSVSWTISKAAGSLSISKTSASVYVGGNTTISITRSGNGAVSAASSDTSVATVSVSGTTVTVTAKKVGSATITVKVAAGTNHNAPADKTCAITVAAAIYGASWDGTSTTKWTRTDAAAGFTDPVPYVAGASSYSSPFDSIQPWAGMVKSERTGGTMVAIPKFYYKLTQSGASIKVQITTSPTSGYSVSPAHMDRGDGKGERNVVYIGRYHCGATAYKSASGQLPKANITRSAARSAIHGLGSTIWQMGFAMRFTIWLLYIVEFADWNSQAKIGYGCGDGKSAGNMGYTDSMPYHTGTTQTSRTNYGLGTQYRNIEGLWDNVFDWCDGCYSASNGLNIIKNPNSFSDTSGGTSVGTPFNGWAGGFAVSSAAGFPMFYGSKAGGSESTYSCDKWNFYTSYPCICVGGCFSRNSMYGLFYVDSTATTTHKGADVGARLQELP